MTAVFGATAVRICAAATGKWIVGFVPAVQTEA